MIDFTLFVINCLGRVSAMMKHFFLNTFILFASMLTTISIFAHGEDKLGPHGGFLLMPGAFHTEVIPEQKDFKVMLLDIDFKNPTVKDSEVKAVIKYNGQSISIPCTAKTDYFFCPVARSLLNKGQLEITATRLGEKGASMAYDLPLRTKP